LSTLPTETIKGLHAYRILCQNCRHALGGIHFPYVGGLAYFECSKCGFVTVVKNEMHGYRIISASRKEFNELVGRKT
jgi:hypothetical protein